MTTPGGNDPYSGHDDSDPYGTAGSGNPYGGTPPPPPPPGGSAPYGGGTNPYGGAPHSAPGTPGGSTDGVSIAALVTAVLCCTGPVAIVLGIIGIVRTKDGKRRGRWMAMVGLVGGVLATALVAALGVFVVWFGQHSVTIENSEAGQCVDVREDGDSVLMFEKDCTEEHDAEIVHTGDYDSATDDAVLVEGEITTEICAINLDQTDLTALFDADIRPEDFAVIAIDPGDMSDGDRYVCYVEPSGGLDEPLL